jgi:hypothetical protein
VRWQHDEQRGEEVEKEKKEKGKMWDFLAWNR